MTEKVVFLDFETLGPGVLLRTLGFPHTFTSFLSTSSEQRLERLAGADIAITNKVMIDAPLLSDLPNLKMIAIAATGTNCVDLEAARERGIVVSNIRSYATRSVPEHVLMLMLALKRSLRGYIADVQSGMWERSGDFCFFSHPINDLAGLRLGIFGRGELGQAVGQVASALGMEVVFAGRRGDGAPGAAYLGFDEVIASSDVLTLHCPLGTETRGLIGAAEFSRMEKKPLLINTARGGIVDEDALVEALVSGQISGAGVDVVRQEPPGEGHPFYPLLDRPNFILTPHIAWGSLEARQILANQLVDNIENFVRGAPRNVL